MKNLQQSAESHAAPETASRPLQISDTSSLYRICSKCGQSKFYQSFPLKGSSSLYKRRRYCMDCVDRKDDPVSPAIHYNFDVRVLDDNKYGFIRFSGPSKKWCNEITLQEAIRFVSLGKARIRTPHHIVQLTNPEPFINYVLERDLHTCHRCGNPGTEAVRLREPDAVKCFCVECARIISTVKASQRGLEQITFPPPPCGKLHVYCDGSVSDNQYGCGVVLVHTNGGRTYHKHFECARKQHSLYVELLAISFALRSSLDFISVGGRDITSMTVLTDVGHIEDLLTRQQKRVQDVYIAKELQAIKLIIGDLKKASPETLVSVQYIGSTRNQLYHLAHRLSRCYKGRVPTIELLPISAAPPKRKLYPLDFRLQVVTEARVAGQLAVTARKFGIAVSTLYRWRQQMKNE